MILRVLVCGGRNFNNQGLLSRVLGGLVDEFGMHFTIIEGDARGADKMAGAWALIHNKDLETYPADWDKYGRAAGAIRNQKMLDEGEPNLVIAFPGGHGTADMIRRATLSGIEVRKIKE